MNTKLGTLFGLTLSVAALLAGSPARGGNAAGEKGSGCNAECREEVEAARAATAKYHEVGVATQAGYFSTVECVAVPGLGAMGIHFVNPGLAFDIDPARPETLLYLPDQHGRLQLVGVEYVAPVLSGGHPWFGNESDPPPTIDNPAPVLFGRSFDGPMAGHEPGQPWHYDLHAWIWQHNPVSMFTQFNPKLSCPN